jgi:hypothetical protein
MKKFVLVFVCFILCFSSLYAKGVEEPREISGPVAIEFWHAMGGARIDLIQGIVDDFYGGESEYHRRCTVYGFV